MRVTAGEAFGGVPATVLEAVGKVVVAATRVEHTAHMIALAVDRDTSGKMLKPTTDKIRDAVADGLMPHCTCRPADVAAWCDAVMVTMKDRNTMLHSVFVQQMGAGGEWLSVQIDRKTGRAFSTEEAEFLAIAQRLVVLYDRGHALLRSLMPQMRRGVHYSFSAHAAGASAYLSYPQHDGHHPAERPTDEETDRWWPTFLAWCDDPARTWPPPTLDGSIA